MYKILLAGCCLLGSISVCVADSLPPYVQVEVDNINLQINQLKAQSAQLTKELQATSNANSDPNASFNKEQIQSQLDRINTQITYLEKQRDALQSHP
jgi:outer membrane murein-binding lipoprotein Lpp